MLLKARKLLFISMFLLLVPSCSLLAGRVSIKATGEYVLHDYDTHTEARGIALAYAKRNALEQVGTYLESITEVQNHLVTKDEIREYTAGIVIVKPEKTVEELIVMPDKTKVLKVHVEVLIDPEDVVRSITLLRKNERMKLAFEQFQRSNVRMKKFDQFDRQLREVSDEEEYRDLKRQRAVILDEILENENQLTYLYEYILHPERACPPGYAPVVYEITDSEGRVEKQWVECLSKKEMMQDVLGKTETYEADIDYPGPGRSYTISKSKYPGFYKKLDIDGNGVITLYELGQMEAILMKISANYPEGDVESIVREFMRSDIDR